MINESPTKVWDRVRIFYWMHFVMCPFLFQSFWLENDQEDIIGRYFTYTRPVWHSSDCNTFVLISNRVLFNGYFVFVAKAHILCLFKSLQLSQLVHRYKKVGIKSNLRIFTTRRSSRITTIIVGRKQNVMNVHRMLQIVRAYSGSAYEYSQVTFQLS